LTEPLLACLYPVECGIGKFVDASKLCDINPKTLRRGATMKNWKHSAGKNILNKAAFRLGGALVLALAVAGCQSPGSSYTGFNDPPASQAESLVLQAGDSISLTFLVNAAYNVVQTIRVDGKITLPGNKGEFQAAGLAPADLEKKLPDMFKDLNETHVTVAVISHVFPVFVQGCVMKPGKIMSTGPMTALEAIMEAGGFDLTKAKMNGVVVSRVENGKVVKHTLDLGSALQSGNKPVEPFYLKPHDIVFVPERWIWL
jgi:protein involved in polysaccharide export with SLBB domain